jgi:MoaA/NifB/PqqE/SkfB family radical SAM enzyme
MLVEDILQATQDPIPMQRSSFVQNVSKKRRLKFNVFKQMYRIMLKKTGSPIEAFHLLLKIRKKYQAVFGEPLLTKVSVINNRYFWRLGTPGFPSKAWNRMHENEVDRFYTDQHPKGLRSVIFAITKRCPFNCKHCFEWENLNRKDRLSTSDIIRLVHKYQDYGTTQMMFSGGEPMLRVKDIYEILKVAKTGTDFWIITSGLGLDEEKAVMLKEAGLTGIMVSIDHAEASNHDMFRGYNGAYNMAIQAAINTKKAGMVLTLSFCAQRTFVNKNHLTKYMNLARDLGASFVQILDPRSSGRFAGDNVELGTKEIDMLEKLYMEYNTSKALADYPIINYLGYHQRRVGCFGAGNRFFYIDTDGDAHICPYCTGKVANTLQHSAEEIISLLSGKSCHIFENNHNI